MTDTYDPREIPADQPAAVRKRREQSRAIYEALAAADPERRANAVTMLIAGYQQLARPEAAEFGVPANVQRFASDHLTDVLRALDGSADR